MNKDAIKRWTDALRSGKFEQTQGILYDGKGYCCLGVACEIFKDELGVKKLGTMYDNEYFSLPTKVRDFLGVSSNPHVYDDYKGGLDLAELNDAYDFSFSELADVIDNNFALPENLSYKLREED